MKYVMLFESFINYDLPNFRVKLLKTGMANGRYLFTCVDGSWNSFFGVFDLDGLKRLEDAMNTECVFAELSSAIQYGEKDKKNIAFEENSIISISGVSSDVKFINIKYRDFDLPFVSGSPVSNVSNPPPGLVVGEDGLQNEHVVHGFSVTTSKHALKETPGVEPIRNYHIVVNELNYVDHHWSDHITTKNYEEAFDDSVGFRKRPIEEGDYGMEDIEPYMASIIDAGIPKGVLKTIEEIKKLNSKRSKYDNLEREFEKLNQEISKIVNSNYKYYYDMGVDLPERKEKALIKTKKEADSQIKRMKSIIKEVSGKIDNQRLERMNIILIGTLNMLVF